MRRAISATMNATASAVGSSRKRTRACSSGLRPACHSAGDRARTPRTSKNSGTALAMTSGATGQGWRVVSSRSKRSRATADTDCSIKSIRARARSASAICDLSDAIRSVYFRRRSATSWVSSWAPGSDGGPSAASNGSTVASSAAAWRLIDVARVRTLSTRIR